MGIMLACRVWSTIGDAGLAQCYTRGFFLGELEILYLGITLVEQGKLARVNQDKLQI